MKEFKLKSVAGTGLCVERIEPTKFEGVKKITASLLLGNIWPALLVDNEIHIFVQVNVMWSKAAFDGLRGQIPVELANQLEVFYNMDWSSYE